VDTNDTYTIGGEVALQRVAWEPMEANDDVTPIIFTSNIVFFHGVGTGHQGYLHIWVSG